MRHILIIEDNADLAIGLRNNLEIEGYRIDIAGDGRTGLELARSGQPDLIILDLTLPVIDGYRVLRTLREEGRDTPVLILSARGEEADKVLGFRMGADDYVTKPFGLLELLARVEAILRRGTAHGQADARQRDNGTDTGDGRFVRFGDVVIDRIAHRVTRAGAEVNLRQRELELLLALADRMGAVVSRDELLRRVWGFRSAVITRTIDSHIGELRRKLEPDPANPRHILTVWKIGYRLVP